MSACGTGKRTRSTMWIMPFVAWMSGLRRRAPFTVITCCDIEVDISIKVSPCHLLLSDAKDFLSTVLSTSSSFQRDKPLSHHLTTLPCTHADTVEKKGEGHTSLLIFEWPPADCIKALKSSSFFFSYFLSLFFTSGTIGEGDKRKQYM